MTASTAGQLVCVCGRPTPRPWLDGVVDQGYRSPQRVAVAVHLARDARSIKGQLQATIGVEELARRAGINRQDASRHLAALVADGFLYAGDRGRGWGVKTVYFLADSAMIRPEVSRVTSQTVTENGAPGHPSPAENGAPGHPSCSPPVPPPRWDGKDLPLPTSPEPHHVQSPIVVALTGGGLGGLTADERTEAQAVLEMLPRKLVPHSRRWRTKMLELLAGLMAQGWHATEIVQIAGKDLPLEVKTPVQFVEQRFDGRTPRRVETEPAERPGRCPTHFLETPCRACIADAKIEARWGEVAG